MSDLTYDAYPFFRHDEMDRKFMLQNIEGFVWQIAPSRGVANASVWVGVEDRREIKGTDPYYPSNGGGRNKKKWLEMCSPGNARTDWIDYKGNRANWNWWGDE